MRVFAFLIPLLMSMGVNAQIDPLTRQMRQLNCEMDLAEALGFDDDEQADGKGILSRVFGKKARRSLEFSCNYHVPPKAFVRFLSGTMLDRPWQA